jgi:hypothetical protein
MLSNAEVLRPRLPPEHKSECLSEPAGEKSALS